MALKRENGDPLKDWPERSPAEQQEWEEGRPQRIADEARAYDVLLSLHEYLLPERYGGKPRQWWRKKALWNMLDHTVKVIDEAVYHHPEAKYPEG